MKVLINLARHSGLNSPCEKTDQQWGGKAYGLMQLFRYKKEVPQTFVISSLMIESIFSLQEHYQRLEKIIFVFKDKNKSDEDKLNVCKEMQGYVYNSNPTFPKDLLEDFNKLPTYSQHSWAIRSSANLEDMTDFSFAGLFHSKLNVSGQQNLQKAVIECFSHIYSYELISYVFKNGINPYDIKLSLIVQEFFHFDYSGVLFTTNPAGKSYQEGVLEFTEGIAENLMNGMENAQTLTFVKDNKKNGLLFKSSDFLKTMSLKGDQRRVLTQLIKETLKLEKTTRRPIDVEWGVQNNKIYYVQMRPVSTLKSDPTIRWTRHLSQERYPLPVSPLGWSILHGVFHTNLVNLEKRFGLKVSGQNDVAVVKNHYVYANDSFFKFPENIKANPFSQIPYLKYYISSFFEIIFLTPVVCLKKMMRLSLFGFQWLVISRLIKAFLFPHAKEILKSWDDSLQGIIQEFDEVSTQKIDTLPDLTLFRYREKLSNIANRYMAPDLAIYIIKMACTWVINKIGKDLGDEKILISLTAGLDHNRTLDMALEMEHFADRIRNNQNALKACIDLDATSFFESLDQEDKAEYRKFVELNGHLTANWDIIVPTWEEDPTKILTMIRPLLLRERDYSLEEKIKKTNQEHQQYLAQLKSKISSDVWMQDFLDEIVIYQREFMRIDEEHHFYCSRVFKSVRKFYLEVGKRFVERGIIHNSDDIYFFTEDQIIRSFCDEFNVPMDSMVSMLRKSFTAAFDQNPPQSFFGDFIENKEENIQIRGNAILGLGASCGRAKGQVCVLLDIEDVKKVKQGDILVVSGPNPVFVPLYSVVSGIIASTGSILSHGMVSAREYAIPAVVGIPNATTFFKDGQQVVVDGDQGVVEVC